MNVTVDRVVEVDAEHWTAAPDRRLKRRVRHSRTDHAQQLLKSRDHNQPMAPPPATTITIRGEELISHWSYGFPRRRGTVRPRNGRSPKARFATGRVADVGPADGRADAQIDLPAEEFGIIGDNGSSSGQPHRFPNTV